MAMRTGSTFTAAVMFAVLTAGCATQEPDRIGDLRKIRLSPEVIEIAKKEGEVQLADDSRVVCRKEMPTGSHRALWRCETVAGKDDSTRKNQQRYTERVIRSKPRVTD